MGDADRTQEVAGSNLPTFICEGFSNAAVVGTTWLTVQGKDLIHAGALRVRSGRSHRRPVRHH